MAATGPSVSVLLPVHDAAGTVARAVASIQRQTRADWELVAVDDGSTDGSRGILEGAARADRRIRVIPQPHGGIVEALNTAVAAARGGWLARMDADDEAHPERLEEQVAFLQAHPEIGVVGCLVAHGGDRVSQSGYARHVEWLNSLVTPEQIALNRFIEAPLAHPSVMFRRELVTRYGGYLAGDFPEDYELWLRWAEQGVRMAKVPRTLLTWHDRPARLSRTDARYAPEAFFRMKAKYLAAELARCAQSRPVLVWGAGRPTRKRAAHLEGQGVAISGYIDIDPAKIGRDLGGRPVLGSDHLPPASAAFVLGYVASRGARELIRSRLRARGYVEGRDFLMAA